MTYSIFKFTVALSAAIILNGCAATKTASKAVVLPFKAAAKTGEIAAKGTYAAGKGVYKTGEYAGKGTYYAGKGMYETGKFAGKTVYYVGKVPVEITDRTLDTTSKFLTVTTQVVDLSGKVYQLSKIIAIDQLDSELGRIKTAKNVIHAFIDAA